MATHLGIELSPAACRIIEIEGGLPWVRRASETAVVWFDVLPPTGPETRAKLESLRKRSAAVVVWGVPSDHRQVIVTNRSYEGMRREALVTLTGVGIDTRGVLADIAPAGARKDPSPRRPVVVALAAAAPVTAALEPLTSAGIRVRSLLTPAAALTSLARTRRELAVPASIEAYVALDKTATCIALLRDGALITARELSWGYLDGAGDAEPRRIDDITMRLGDALSEFFGAVGASSSAVSQICVCGPLPELRSMTTRLTQRLDVEVEALDSLYSIDPDEIAGGPDDFRERSAEMRLAWAAAADWPPAINLLRARRRQATKTALSRAALVAGAVAGLGIGWQVQQSAWWRSRASTLVARVSPSVKPSAPAARATPPPVSLKPPASGPTTTATKTPPATPPVAATKSPAPIAPPVTATKPPAPVSPPIASTKTLPPVSPPAAATKPPAPAPSPVAATKSPAPASPPVTTTKPPAPVSSPIAATKTPAPTPPPVAATKAPPPVMTMKPAPPPVTTTKPPAPVSPPIAATKTPAPAPPPATATKPSPPVTTTKPLPPAVATKPVPSPATTTKPPAPVLPPVAATKPTTPPATSRPSPAAPPTREVMPPPSVAAPAPRREAERAPASRTEPKPAPIPAPAAPPRAAPNAATPLEAAPGAAAPVRPQPPVESRQPARREEPAPEPAPRRAAPTRPPEIALPFDASLGTILYSPDRKLAIIDGRIIGVGDEVRGARVTEITPNAVFLRDPQGRLRRLSR